jgi:hemoglobin
MDERDRLDKDWSIVEALGGEERFEALITRFYDRLFVDPMIGFFFAGKDKRHLVVSQMAYLQAHLGDRRGVYEGPSIRASHAHLPILVGHFDRRHKILVEVLDEFAVADPARKAWLELDASLRDFVVRTGAAARERMLRDQ